MMNRVLLIGILVFTVFATSCTKENAGTHNLSEPAGQGGSLAKMITVGQYLYVINQSKLLVYDVQNPLEPVFQSTTDVGFGIETIFPFGDYLFIGSNNGMYIYDLTSPTNPTLATENVVEHITGCDPVVANENYAYVTLNTNRVMCGTMESNNVLLTFDISSIQNTFQVSSQNMAGPKGLALDGDRLFVCDATNGIVIFDLSIDPQMPLAVDSLLGFTGNDIILSNNIMMVVCDDGLRQFDYSNMNDINQISFLSTDD